MSHPRINAQQWQAIADHLAVKGHVLDLSEPPSMLSGGVANFNFLVLLDGRKAVLRCPPEGPLPPGANDVAREYKVLSSLGEAFAPAPKALHFCDDETLIGSKFCISEFREGICISRELPEALQSRPGIGAALSELQVTTLAQLHGVDVAAVGLSDLGKAEGFLQRQIGGWFKRAERVLSEKQLAKFALLRDWLNDHLPAPRSATLVHNDFKLDNMLIDPDTLAVNGVVDWDMCTIGDPIYELTILLAYWGSPDDNPLYAQQCRMPCEADGWWHRQAVVNRYLELTGFSLSQDELLFYWTLTQYRTVVVYAQLYAVFLRTGNRPGQMSAQECEGMARLVDELTDYQLQQLGKTPDFLKR